MWSHKIQLDSKIIPFKTMLQCAMRKLTNEVTVRLVYKLIYGQEEGFEKYWQFKKHSRLVKHQQQNKSVYNTILCHTYLVTIKCKHYFKPHWAEPCNASQCITFSFRMYPNIISRDFSADLEWRFFSNRVKICNTICCQTMYCFESDWLAFEIRPDSILRWTPV